MSSTEERADAGIDSPGVATVPLRFEVTVLPVADVDRAKAFYLRLGWRLDADFPIDEGFRIVQFTPPGSPACSSRITWAFISAAHRSCT